ncbi:MAG: FAD-binding oxidoreductase [Hyphomicrobiaceae bacterium]|nr:MAG: FAD-binding oxidoreductase [Hyphomicrobiaceae bacterium]
MDFTLIDARPQKARPVPPELIARLVEIVGAGAALTAEADTAAYCESWRDDVKGRTPLVLKPHSTEEVAAIVKVCAKARVPIVPQGGRTGLTGASQPHEDASEIVVSTERMNRILDVDLLNDTMTLEAGVVLAEIQARASDVDRLFPLSLGAQGSCRIGGNISTNAGGTQVLRYGNTRALVLGLEVVLPDGEIWNGLKGLRKDNTGYDLKHLFIGAEGTLGIITKAVIKLFPKPTAIETAFLATQSAEAGVELLSFMRQRLGESISAFELIARICIDWTVELLPQHKHPLPGDQSAWFVLMDISGQGEPGSLRDGLENALAEAHEAGLLTNATIAQSGEHARKLWLMREDFADMQRRRGVSIKHDVSVPVSKVPEFLQRAGVALEASYPGIRICVFGHVGDGNLHYNPFARAGSTGIRFAAERERINRIVHDIIADLGGSISAEHGIGRLRLAEIERYKSPVETALMRAVKLALDPHGIMNPGKVVRL